MAEALSHMTNRVDLPDGITMVVCQCSCGSVDAITLPTAELEAYHSGALAQRAMVSLDDHQRERIITGICTPCWDALFEGIEEDDA